MRLPDPEYRLLYGIKGFQAAAERDGLRGCHRFNLENLRNAALESLGTLPAWPVGGATPGDADNGAAGRGI